MNRSKIIEVMARGFARSPMDGSLRERMRGALDALEDDGMAVVPVESMRKHANLRRDVQRLTRERDEARRKALEEAARVADDVQESEREEKRFDKEDGDYDPYSYGAGFSDGSITTSVNIGTAIRALLSSTRAGSGSMA